MATSIETTEISTDDTVLNILTEAGVSFRIVLFGATVKDKWECDQWRVTLSKGTKIETFDYFTGTGHRKSSKPVPLEIKRFPNTLHAEAWHKVHTKPKMPEIAGVLSSLVMDANAGYLTFYEFCMDYGYDDDSIKAKKTYDQCKENADKIKRILHNEILDALRLALQNY